MSEGSLWTYVRTNLLPPGIHATRIENGVSSGFPDVHYTYQGKSGTIELKFLRKKNLPFGTEGLRRDQEWWIRDQVNAGGTVFILAQVHSNLFLVPGKHVFTFNAMTLGEMGAYATWIGQHRKIRESQKVNFAKNL